MLRSVGAIMYWVCIFILVCLETFLLAHGFETLPIMCVGLCWMITTVGFLLKSIRFSDYLKSNYPTEYKNMLKTKKLSYQLKYKPKANDSQLMRYQTELTHYLRFVPFGILAPFAGLLVFM